MNRVTARIAMAAVGAVALTGLAVGTAQATAPTTTPDTYVANGDSDGIHHDDNHDGIHHDDNHNRGH